MSNIVLRPLSLSDTNNIVKWRNDYAVKKYLYSQAELTQIQHIEYFEKNIVTGKCVQFIIVLEEDNKHTDIGTVFIKNIDYVMKNGEFGIFIGEECGRGKGYARFATEQILKYGFEVLKLHRIFLTVMADNIPALKTYEKVGFVCEGKMRDEYLRTDGYVDIIIMSFLENEWFSFKNN